MTERQAKQLGTLIRKARETAGLKYRQLAELTGLPLTWLAYLEAGRSLEPLADRLALLAEVLEIDPAEIDRVSGDYLAESLPTVRTYFRSKGKATEAELDELERVVREVQERYRDDETSGSARNSAGAKP
ncbi:MAG: helix-turn-helix transcriptional regulator [Solirubrobacteraceae bacterium]|jgi:transcriptional regulator with XRE-family HTH domain